MRHREKPQEQPERKNVEMTRRNLQQWRLIAIREILYWALALQAKKDKKVRLEVKKQWLLS